MSEGEENLRLWLLPVTRGFTIATVSGSLCVWRSEAGDPAGLRFSLTHNINHFMEVGQTEQEIHLKCSGTARAGGRQQKNHPQNGLVWQEVASESQTGTFACSGTTGKHPGFYL